MRSWILSLFCSLTVIASAQNEPSQNWTTEGALEYLASDELEGRRPGTDGHQQAAMFIRGHFNTYTDSTWFQSFSIAEPMLAPEHANGIYKEIEGAVEATDNREEEQRTQIWVPLFSAGNIFPVRESENGSAVGELVYAGYGITSPEMDHDDYDDLDVEDKVVVIDVSSPDGIHPHSQYMQYHGLDYRIRNAAENGAVAVIFVQGDATSNPPRKSFTSQIASGLPAIFYGGDVDALLNFKEEVMVRVDLKPDFVTGYNVIGFNDRGYETTLIIGAHYDHLGYGDQSSLYRGEPAIHNGADDNASGTVGLMWLAKELSETEIPHNLMFIAFSGEERGLLGSDYFTETELFESMDIVAMLNMDMIGRLEESRELLVSGTGTADEWNAIIENANQYNFDLAKSPGGTGASDHTSFYQMGIPVLHFFTGTHEDYHKPSDDADKINYAGLVDVASYVRDIAESIPATLTFRETKDDESQSTPRFNVTLGIIPDYVFGGPGVKVDGVTDGKPADEAGIEMGDIILKLGDYPATDIYAYMRALGAFQPGQTITVTVLRDEEELEMELTF